MATSSSSPPKFDVFLNFRGPDTRKRFVGHLYKALMQKKFRTFLDSKSLGKGTEILSIREVIEDSRLSIVVLSENFADSKWCLNELVRIVECRDEKKQIVLPIFYGINPSDVRKLKGNFAAAFDRYDRDSLTDKEDLKKWKSAFTEVSNIYGWVSENYKDEADLVREIVDGTSENLIPSSSRKAGMGNHIREMNSRLSPGVDNARNIARCETCGNLGCHHPMLNHLPKNLGNLDSLKKIEVEGSGTKALPVSRLHMKKPKILSIDGCKEMRGPFSRWSFSRSHHGSCEPLLGTMRKREGGGMKNGSLLTFSRNCYKLLFFRFHP